MKKYLTIAIVVLVVLLVGVSYTAHKMWQDRNRLKSNQEALIKENESYRLKDGSPVMSTQVIQFTKKEFKQFMDSTQKSLLKEMDIRVRQVQSAANTIFTTGTEFTATVKNITIPTRDSDGKITNVPAKYWKQDSEWWTVECTEIDTTRIVKVDTRNTMDQFLYKERVGWKFWKKRRIRQSIHFGNPDTKIEYTKYVEIGKE